MKPNQGGEEHRDELMGRLLGTLKQVLMNRVMVARFDHHLAQERAKAPEHTPWQPEARPRPCPLA